MDMAGVHAAAQFLVQSASTQAVSGMPEPTYRGALEDVLALLE